jgi:hypothetical protein
MMIGIFDVSFFDPNPYLIAVKSKENQIIVYDYSTKREQKSFSPHKSEIDLIVLNLEASHIATCSKKADFIFF